MPNTYACKLVSNPNVPIFLPRVCTLVLFITMAGRYTIRRVSLSEKNFRELLENRFSKRKISRLPYKREIRQFSPAKKADKA